MTIASGTKTASNVRPGSAPDWNETVNWKEIIADSNEEAVFSALDNPEWDWRTLQGLHRDTGLGADEIQRILGKYAALIRAVRSKEHGTVYQLKNRSQPRADEPIIDKALDYLSMGKRRKIA